jgi:hypothetical protein
MWVIYWIFLIGSGFATGLDLEDEEEKWQGWEEVGEGGMHCPGFFGFSRPPNEKGAVDSAEAARG